MKRGYTILPILAVKNGMAPGRRKRMASTRLVRALSSETKTMPQVTTTYLEMHSPEELRPKRCTDDRFWVGEAAVPQWEFNRFLYYTVGAQWAWNDKRVWSDEQWRAYVESDQLRTFGAYYDGAPAGYYELHRDDENAVEIAYFGLMPAFLGRQLGGALLTSAIEEAWRMAPARVWVHTCTLDHPAALANYEARGLRIYKVEKAG